MRPITNTSVITPKSLDDFHIPRSSLNFIGLLRDNHVVAGKIVVAAYNGYGLLALGEKQIFHVHILDMATNELSRSDKSFPNEIVTTTDPNLAAPIPGAFIKGAYFSVTNADNPQIVIENRSQTFGDFEGELLGKDVREVGEYLLMRAVRESAFLNTK